MLLSSCQHPSTTAPPFLLRFVRPTPSEPSLDQLKLMQSIEASGTDIRVAVQPSTGSVFVVSQLQQGKGDIGLAQADVVYLAFSRGVPDNPAPHNNLRGIAVGGINRLVVYGRRASAINGVSGLRGKRVAIAPAGTAGELLSRIVLEASGLTYNDIEVRVHQIRDMSRHFESEQLDAMIMVGALQPGGGTAPIPEDALRLISLDPAVIDRVRRDYPFIKPVEMTWHTETSTPQFAHSVGADSLLIARKDLPEAIVYRFTAAVMQAIPTNNTFAIDPDTAPATPIPLHPGAARYYRELQLLR